MQSKECISYQPIHSSIRKHHPFNDNISFQSTSNSPSQTSDIILNSNHHRSLTYSAVRRSIQQMERFYDEILRRLSHTLTDCRGHTCCETSPRRVQAVIRASRRESHEYEENDGDEAATSCKVMIIPSLSLNVQYVFHSSLCYAVVVMGNA